MPKKKQQQKTTSCTTNTIAEAALRRKERDKMEVYKISVYDKAWRTICEDYGRCDDLQQAEIAAKKAADWLGAEHWEVTRIS